MGGTRVYIGGLPYGVREKDLERFFKGYGRIRDILIKNGYGFVVSLQHLIKRDYGMLDSSENCLKLYCFNSCLGI